jgi:hypothetical protein
MLFLEEVIQINLVPFSMAENQGCLHTSVNSNFILGGLNIQPWEAYLHSTEFLYDSKTMKIILHKQLTFKIGYFPILLKRFLIFHV